MRGLPGRLVWLRRAILPLVAGFVAFAAPASAENRVALVIGNDGYRNVPALQKAVADSRTVTAALKQLGFTVFQAENLGRRQMSETLSRFQQALAPGDTALFYYAGHGFEIRGQNFLLPTDVPAAEPGQQDLVKDSSFAIDSIIERIESRGARTAIVVLDACRDNPFERRGKRSLGGSRGLARMEAPDGVFILFSAGIRQSALDRLSEEDPDNNSVFTRSFARELQTPGLTLVQIAKRTQADVRSLAASIRHDQTPAYYDQVVGDVVLNTTDAPPKDAEDPQPRIAALPPVQQAVPQVAPERAPAMLNAPIASFSRHNGGWSVNLSFADPVTAIAWRAGEAGPFRETGFLDALDPRTRKRMPNPSFELDADSPAVMLQVHAIGVDGEALGPFPIRFEPRAALERDQRRILEMTSGSWLSLNDQLLYFTHLVSYRCAIREVRIGIDSVVPDQALKLPPCDMRDPVAIPSNLVPYLRLRRAARLVSVELTYQDGSTSQVKTFRR